MRWLERLRSCDAGSVAIIFPLTIVPLIMFGGAALDYSRASEVRNLMYVAADAAALSAVNLNAMATTTAQAQSVAEKVFDSQVAAAGAATSVSRTVTVTQSGTVRSVSVAFQAVLPTSFLGIMGVSQIPIGGTVGSSGTPPTYIDFYLLLDNTPSMGVAATPADITRMQSLTVGTSDGTCAFACHITGSTTDNYAIAKKNNVVMRIDVVRSATQQLMDTATATAMVSGQFRAAVYTFGTSCNALGATAVSLLSSNLSSVKTAASAVDLMAIPYQNYNNDQCTDFDGTLASMNTTIGTPGDGSTAAAPQKVLFFVSDGVADAYYPSTCSEPTTGGRCQEPLNTTACTAIKARGIRIAVLYTTYLPLTGNQWYDNWIKPFTSRINPQMAACASPGLFFEVSPSQGIADAMTALFQKTVSQAKLSR